MRGRGLEVAQLGMQFLDAGTPVDVFHDVSFSVDPGESVAIIGESGVGKTTLLYLIAALESPSKGSIRIGGVDLGTQLTTSDKQASFRGSTVGFVFQFHHLLPEFSAVENVALPLIIQGTPIGVALQRAEQLLERVSLSHRLEHRPGALSGGEQQRVAIARALAAEPGLLLADEPTGNLDSQTAASVIDVLISVQRDFGVTLVIATHSQKLAQSLDRTLRLTRSGILEQ